MTIRRGDSIIAGNAGGIPSQTGQSGKFLTTNGTMASWGDTVDYTNITNCITEIPQDIKLELNNGTLTVKAGSKVYVPNGFEADGTTLKFDKVVIESDIRVDTPYADEPFFIYYFDNTVVPFINYMQCSGPSSTIDFGFWYDTTNNFIKLTTQGEVSDVNMSFPLAIINGSSNGDWASIDQVFNGFGYIGSTVFALPGVKGLIPNGRNEDGSLKNIEFTVDSVKTYTTINNMPTELVGCWCMQRDNNIGWDAGDYWTYDKQQNLFLHGSEIFYKCDFAYYLLDSNRKIASFTPKTAFHAVDYNECIHDIDSKQDKSTAINYNNISNCITEIPQDIKLELNNGTLTLKAGSKVYIPNGFETSTEPLYAWTVNGNNSEVYYTESETPAVGDKTYNENGTYTGYKVNEVSGTTLVLQKGSGSVVEQVTVTRDTSKDTYFSKPDTTKPKFDVKIIDVDLSIPKWNNTVPGLISMTSNRELWTALPEQQFSGSSAPTTQYALWYDTTNNIIKSSSNAGSSWKEGYCLPIAICTADSSKWASIEQVFKGFGYIGSTIFALPGVKGLIPNARNADGSLNNIEILLDSVKTLTFPVGVTNTSINMGLTTDAVIDINFFTYYEKENIIKNLQQSLVLEVNCATLDVNNGKITSFTPKTAFHALDYNDKSTISGWSIPDYNSGITLTFSKVFTNAGESKTMAKSGLFCFEFLANNVISTICFYVNNRFVGKIGNSQTSLAFWDEINFPVTKGDVVKVTAETVGGFTAAAV